MLKGLGEKKEDEVMSVVREHLHRMPFRKPPWEGSMLGREGSVGKSTYAQVYGPSLHLQHP